VLGAVGLALSVVLAKDGTLAIAALTLGLSGIMTTLPLFWSLPTAFLAGTGAAAGIALINSLGNLAGFVSPYAVGWLKDATGSTDAGVYMLSVAVAVGVLLTLAVPKQLVNR
jgi:nitrate/nitrite transporter NarK